MEKSKLALFFDSLFITFIIFTVLFIWLRKILKNAILSFIFSNIISLLAFIAIFYFVIKRNKKHLLSKSLSKFNEECLNFLIYSPLKFYDEFFEKLLDATKINSYIFKTKNSIIFINLKTETTDTNFQNLIEEFHKTKEQNFNFYIITKKTTKSFDELLLNSSLPFKILEISTIQKVMELKNFYPISMESLKENSKNFKSKYKLKSRIKYLQKSDFKKLFFSGISLLFISLITPYSFLYLIIGSILLLFSIICLFKKITPSKNINEEFISSIKK